MKAKINLENIWAYLTGKYRYALYYTSNFQWLIRTHIREQIDARIKSMDQDCYNEGQCKMCGCETTALQMADKACDKPCYPKMANKRWWTLYKRNRLILDNGLVWQLRDGKFKQYIL